VRPFHLTLDLRAAFQHVEILTLSWSWMLCSWLPFAQVSQRFSVLPVFFKHSPSRRDQSIHVVAFLTFSRRMSIKISEKLVF
jgi:hypothetical protein